MKEILSRLASPTPKFFRVLRNLGLTVAALSMFVMQLSNQGVSIPPVVIQVLNAYTLTGGAIAALVSQLTKIWTSGDETINP